MPKIDDVFERAIRLDERVSRIDEKIDRLIAAVPAEPTAAGQTPPPADSAGEGGNPLPTNPSEVVGFLINKLGKLAIPVLIMAILGGAYLGTQEVFSTINQRDASVRETFTKTAVATLEVGESVVKNTEKLIELNSKLGEAGQTLLTLQQKAAEEAAKAVTENQKAERAVQQANDLRKNLIAKEKLLVEEQKKVNIKDRELSVLRTSLTEEKQKLEEANDKLQSEQAALARERGEIALSQADVAAREGLLRNKDAELSETQATIASLKEDLKRLRVRGQNERTQSKKALTDLRAELATLQVLQNSSQYQVAALETQSEDLIDLLENARTTIQDLGAAAALVPEVPRLQELAPEPPEPKTPSHIEVVAEILRQYARTPDAVTSEEWQRLDDEDVIPADLDSLLKTDLGYELVLKLNVTELDDEFEKPQVGYFPIRRTTSDQVIGFPLLRISEDGTGWDVEPPIGSFMFVRLRDLTDFNDTRVAAIADVSYFGEINNIETIMKFQSDKNVFTFSEFLKIFFARLRTHNQ